MADSDHDVSGPTATSAGVIVQKRSRDGSPIHPFRAEMNVMRAQIVLLVLALSGCGGGQMAPLHTPDNAPSNTPAVVTAPAADTPEATVEPSTPPAGQDHGFETDTAADARVAVLFGRKSVRGSLSGEVVRRILTRHKGEVRHCYALAEAASPDMAGFLSVQFSIEPDGTVSVATPVTTATATTTEPSTTDEAASDDPPTLDDPALVSCILERLRSWTFPPPEGGGHVSVVQQYLLRRAPTLELDAPTVTGSLSPEAVQAAAREQQHKLLLCYETPDLVPGSEATLSLRYVIERDGSVSEASVFGIDQVLSDRRARCMEQTVRAWTFPAPSDRAPVTALHTIHTRAVNREVARPTPPRPALRSLGSSLSWRGSTCRGLRGATRRALRRTGTGLTTRCVVAGRSL